ncbi:Protein of unknown function (DUF1428) [Candidatus Nitrososphaera evergladensis SR1]|jgi:uncharacterized protein YbaA (DUF1428 family)|uniref:DUF1428 domain-containing protein n=1 Tax=Candidatus Nitrososphaera evergladensis SR1 TaxID=1459636 RepID=A0A075MSM1_9ARCH|nr:DUF1428 family protein [Candidatus Nitrososphaera evergladensis]AIF84130.1 Protein of unknown function (DUF1428) [Candidatus Nitrososphaera evergladensis SR1]
MNNNNKTESAAQKTTATTSSSSHLEAFLYRVPKKNHDAVAQNLKQFVPWFEKQGVRIEYYQLGNYKIMEGIDGIAKTLSAGEDEDIWMELQYFRDYKHCEDAYAKMMQDKSIEQLGKEFFGLITQGTSLVNGRFNRLRV